MGPVLLIANPGADTYGSDLQLLELVTAAVDGGWHPVVVLGADGPLRQRLRERGADVRIAPFPVLRRSMTTLVGLVKAALITPVWIIRLTLLIRQERPVTVLVNTVTLPWWIVAARLARRPVLCYLHEAEDDDPLSVRRVLNAPLFLASKIIANGRTSADSLAAIYRRLRARTVVIPNGVAGPPTTTPGRSGGTGPAGEPASPMRLAVVGRLSPRKATVDAVDVLAIVRHAGVDAVLDICGEPFDGYEWYREAIMKRAADLDMVEHVKLLGYVDPIWPELERATVVLAPSLGESFGNVVVQAQLAGRPVVATAVRGHLETVEDEVTGLLVPPRDPAAMAAAVTRLLAEGEFAAALAERARKAAQSRYSLVGYADRVRSALAGRSSEG